MILRSKIQRWVYVQVQCLCHTFETSISALSLWFDSLYVFRIYACRKWCLYNGMQRYRWWRLLLTILFIATIFELPPVFVYLHTISHRSLLWVLHHEGHRFLRRPTRHPQNFSLQATLTLSYSILTLDLNTLSSEDFVWDKWHGLHEWWSNQDWSLVTFIRFNWSFDRRLMISLIQLLWWVM